MIKIIKIKKLKAHEKTDKDNLKRVENLILQLNRFSCPIIVETKNFVILDGHHRVKALINLGYQKIPAYLVNYDDKKIKLINRRKNINLTKDLIIKKALANQLFPYKTSKHLIPNRPTNLNINLNKLI